MNEAKETGLPDIQPVSISDKPLRIAIVYGRLPFPMMRGDQLTVAHLIAYLSARGHDVDFHTLDLDGTVSPEQQAWLDSSCRLVRVHTLPRWRRVLGALKYLAQGRPLQCGLFECADLSDELNTKIQAGEYDIVYAYYLRSARTLRHAFKPMQVRHFGERKTAAFLAMQLSQALNTRRIRDNQRAGPLRWMYSLEWRLLRREEARIWQRFTHTLLIGPKDVEAVEAACQAERQPVINNWLRGAHGTNINRFRVSLPEERVDQQVLFSGALQYEPNCQAVTWFARHCWPEIRRRHPGARFVIVGRDPVAEITALDGVNGIQVVGTVPDIGPYTRSSHVCVNPMLAAGGMQNKLIEYMASGVAVVATSVANEGILAEPDRDLLIADGQQAFTDAVCRILDDDALAERLAKSGRSFVERHWTWEAHFEQLENDFHSALTTTSEVS